jgi:hypothetical protein
VQRSHHAPSTSFSIPPSHPPHYSHAPRNTHKATKRRARTNSSPSHAERGKQPAISYPFLLYHKRRRATQGRSPSSARDRIQSAVQRDPNAWMVLALRLRRRYGAAHVVRRAWRARGTLGSRSGIGRVRWRGGEGDAVVRTGRYGCAGSGVCLWSLIVDGRCVFVRGHGEVHACMYGTHVRSKQSIIIVQRLSCASPPSKPKARMQNHTPNPRSTRSLMRKKNKPHTDPARLRLAQRPHPSPQKSNKHSQPTRHGTARVAPAQKTVKSPHHALPLSASPDPRGAPQRLSQPWGSSFTFFFPLFRCIPCARAAWAASLALLARLGKEGRCWGGGVLGSAVGKEGQTRCVRWSMDCGKCVLVCVARCLRGAAARGGGARQGRAGGRSAMDGGKDVDRG